MPELALVVDDVSFNRDLLSEMLEESHYTVLEAANGREALELIRANLDDLAVILLDLVMPEVSGMEVLATMEKHGWTERIPVLIISGEDSPETERRCFEYGVFDFIHKPFNQVLVESRIKNATSLFRHKNHLEEMVREQTAHLQAVNEDIIEMLGSVVEARDMESGQHVRRVKGFSRILAEQVMADCPEYGLTPQIVDLITSASALHDVGKIMIEDRILLKPGRLTDEEFAEMKTHTLKGCAILDQAPKSWDRDYLRFSYDICRSHHEKWDGRGYPDGLAGDDIPIAAQIVSVADCYDALTTQRVYKPAYTPDEAYTMIRGGQCGAFGPRLMACFDRTRDAFEQLARTTASAS